MKRVMTWLFNLFLASVALFLCGAFAVGNAEDVRDYGRVDGWAETTGVLTVLPGQSDIKVFAIWYEYEVDGQTYTGERVRFFQWVTFGDEETAEARAWVSERVLGDEVTVYYDPTNPERSVLYRDLNGGQTTLRLAGWSVGVCILLSPAFLFVGYLLFLRGFFRWLFPRWD